MKRCNNVNVQQRLSDGVVSGHLGDERWLCQHKELPVSPDMMEEKSSQRNICLAGGNVVTQMRSEERLPEDKHLGF